MKEELLKKLLSLVNVVNHDGEYLIYDSEYFVSKEITKEDYEYLTGVRWWE